jgi:hypothetical protein
MRTHIKISLTAADTDANPGAFFGTIVVDSTMQAAGRPDPSTDFAADWLYLSLMGPGIAQNTTVGPPNAPTEWLYGNEVDVRARRRLHEMNDNYVFCLKNSGSAALNYTLFVRALVALP